MNRILAAVDWPGVLGDLADADPHAVARWYADGYDTPPADGHGYPLLAHLVRYSDAVSIAHVVTSHGCSQPDRVAMWLGHTARLLWHMTSAVLNDPVVQRSDPPQMPAGRGALRVHPSLTNLPFLDLAADVADQRRASGVSPYLVVTTDTPLHCSVRGCVNPDGTVLGDDGQPQRATVVLLAEREAWPHELGHVLDPQMADRTFEQVEAFAAHVAAALRGTDEPPRTLAAAAPLVAEAAREAGTRPPGGSDLEAVDADGLPAAGTAAAMTLLCLSAVAQAVSSQRRCG